jgi:hypothetical protein
MTYYCFLVGALAVAGLGVWVRQRAALPGHAMIILGVVGCIACVGWRVQQTLLVAGGSGPDRGQAVVGYYLAQQVLAEAGDQQGSAVLLLPPESVVDADTAGTYVGTFARVLRGFPGLKVEVFTLDAPAKAARAGKISLAAFQQAASKASQPFVAFVSFAGVPVDIEKFVTSGSKTEPPFFVFDPWGTTNWLSALRTGRVKGVIVPRPGLDRGATRNISGEPQEVFNRLYLMGTPATAARVAQELGAGKR